MNIEVMKWKISEIVEGYQRDEKTGTVTALNGKLNIRPSYQREFVYDTKQQKAVINTVLKGYPLNSMYWVDNPDDFLKFEILDGQQRTISICEFIKGKDGKGGFAILDDDGKQKFFTNLSKEKQDKILNYELSINVCTGENEEKMEWFKTINIAGEKLTEQEIRNAVYAGPWVSDAKFLFSKRGCPADITYSKYLVGDITRQDFLETAIKWALEVENPEYRGKRVETIEQYMALHQKDKNAKKLWNTFSEIMNWVLLIFPTYRKEMKGVEWGRLYSLYSERDYDSIEVEKLVSMYMEDDEIVNKKGIYEYILSDGNPAKERLLNLRTFTQAVKRSAYERQGGHCAKCGKYIDFEESHADHINPWSKGGKTVPENCQVLCQECNGTKSNK